MEFDELREELVLRLKDDKHVIASSAAVLTNKLRQVANGAIYMMRRHAVDGLNTQLFGEHTAPFPMYGIENLDIDTPYDLSLARAWAAGGRAPQSAPWAPLTCDTDFQEALGG